MALFSSPVVVMAAWAAGLLMGALGGGGAILSIPLLTGLVGLSMREALPTALVGTFLSSGTALAVYAVRSRVAWRAGLRFALFSVGAAAVAGALATRLPEVAIRVIFGAVLAWALWATLKPAKPPVNGEPGTSSTWKAGLLAGAVTGLTGAGGGFVALPALRAARCVPEGDLAGTAFVVISLNGAVAMTANTLAGQAFPVAGLGFAIPMAVGAGIGAWFGCQVPVVFARRAFAVVLFATAAMQFWT
jgi:uncharacterized protein